MKSVVCSNCSKSFAVDDASTVVVCSCGLGIYIGMAFQSVSLVDQRTIYSNHDSARLPSQLDQVSNSGHQKIGGRKLRTEFVTAIGASYSLQNEMSKAGIYSIEHLFEALNSIRKNPKYALIVAESFDVSVHPEIYRAVLTRLLLCASVAVFSDEGECKSLERSKLQQLLYAADISFLPITSSQTARSTLDVVVDTLMESLEDDGRSNPLSVVAAGGKLKILFDTNLYSHQSFITADSVLKNARALTAAVLVLLSVTITEKLERFSQHSLLGKSFNAS